MTDASWEMRTRGVSGRRAVEIGELLSLEYPNESAEWVLGDRAVSEAEEEAAVRRTVTWIKGSAPAVPRPLPSV